MIKEVYEKLVDVLMKRGGTLPPSKCREFYLLAEELFTEEEAALAISMPFGPITAEKMAQDTSRNFDEVEELLERMANKGLLFSRVKEGVHYYTLLQLVPGISEYQFMRGTSTERDKRLARLFEDFHEITWGTPEANKNRPTVPFSRVLVVEKNIPAGVTVHAYDKVSEYIKNARFVSVAQCFCRHQAELLEKPCDKPKETCFCFGPTAEYLAERGFGRLVSNEEALRILDQCEEAGLVHCTSNVVDRIDFLCNCCLCHCGIIQTFTDPERVNFGAVSNYIARVKEEKCVACEDCIDICPMDAFTLKDDIVVCATEKCIGCGLCLSACISDGLEMVLRDEPLTPPENFRELMQAMAASMPKKD